MEKRLEQILEESLVVSRKASAFIRSQVNKVAPSDIEEKELNSLVSYVDKEAEKILVDGLSEILPEAGFITEEDTLDRAGEEFTWVLDPLDGTTNFLHKVPHFSVSVALRKDDETIVGIVIEVNSEEEWTAIKGQGAYMNGDRICVCDKSFNNVLIATGFPYSNNHDYDAYFEVIKYWLTNSRGMRRMGSAALDLCYVACGRFGAYYESTLNPWDVAAGALIVMEAGGKVSDFGGGDGFVSGRQIIASAPHIYNDVLSNIQKHVGQRHG